MIVDFLNSFLAPQVIPVTSKAEFDLLKSRIASTKAEIRREKGVNSLNSPDSSPSSKVHSLAGTRTSVQVVVVVVAGEEAVVALMVVVVSGSQRLGSSGINSVSGSGCGSGKGVGGSGIGSGGGSFGGGGSGCGRGNPKCSGGDRGGGNSIGDGSGRSRESGSSSVKDFPSSCSSSRSSLVFQCTCMIYDFHFVLLQRRRVHSTSKLVEKMKKRQAEQVDLKTVSLCCCASTQ